MKVFAPWLIAVVCLLAPPAIALPAQGLYLSVLNQTRTPAIEFVMGDGVLQIGYLPEPQLAERLWFGSLRLPIPVLQEGHWWPSLKLLAGYHRQQAPVGTPFQAAEIGTSLTKALPFNVSLYGFGSWAQSLSGSDSLPPLMRAEAGIAWKAARGMRLFMGYQRWQSPGGLSAGLASFATSRDFSGVTAGIDYQLGQLAGFSGDD